MLLEPQHFTAQQRLDALLRLVALEYNCPANIDDIPPDDAATWQLFRQGDTEHILHFRASGMKAYLIALGPERLDDLETLLLLYRSPELHDRIPVFMQYKNSGIPYAPERNCISPVEQAYVKQQVGIAWQTAFLITHYPVIHEKSIRLLR